VQGLIDALGAPPDMRGAVCPHATCFEAFPSSAALATHCRSEHGAVLAHPHAGAAAVPVDVTGHMGSLQAAVGLLACHFERSGDAFPAAAEPVATYWRGEPRSPGAAAAGDDDGDDNDDARDGFKTVAYPDALQGAVEAPSLQTTLNLIAALEAACPSEGHHDGASGGASGDEASWSSSQPCGVRRTLEALQTAFAAPLSRLGTGVIDRCAAPGCGHERRVPRLMLTLRATDLAALANFPVRAGVSNRQASCAACGGRVTSQFDIRTDGGEAPRGLVVHCTAGLDALPNGSVVHVGDAALGLAYVVAAAVTEADGDRPRFYTASMAGQWLVADDNLALQPAAPPPGAVRFVLLSLRDDDDESTSDSSMSDGSDSIKDYAW
jgi:hypothetical protein